MDEPSFFPESLLKLKMHFSKLYHSTVKFCVKGLEFWFWVTFNAVTAFAHFISYRLLQSKGRLLLQPLHRFAVSTFLLLGLVLGQKDCLHLIMEHCESTFTQPFTLSNRRRILTNQRTIRHLRCVSQFSLTNSDILCDVTILDRVSTFKHHLK